MEIMGFVILGFIVFMYFLPWVIAYRNNHKNVVSIFVLNLLAGWTFIGWVAGLVWAFKKD